MVRLVDFINVYNYFDTNHPIIEGTAKNLCISHSNGKTIEVIYIRFFSSSFVFIVASIHFHYFHLPRVNYLSMQFLSLASKNPLNMRNDRQKVGKQNNSTPMYTIYYHQFDSNARRTEWLEPVYDGLHNNMIPFQSWSS